MAPAATSFATVPGGVRRVFALALAFMSLLMALSVWTALQEPSLGWRFVADPQGQGILAYSPRHAVKISQREEALERFVAIRRVPPGAEGPEGLPLDSLISVEAPSMLARQDDLDRFFVLQREVWTLMRGALADGQPVQLQRADGAWLTQEVHARTWEELGWLFLVPLLSGLIPFVVGMALCAYRWQSPGARFLGLASVMAFMSMAEICVVTGRLWLLPPWFAEAGQIYVRCTSLTAAWAFVMMMCHYPTSVKNAWRWTAGSGAFLLVLLALNILQWPDSQTYRYKVWLVVSTLILFGLSIWQTVATRADPVHRAAARWLGASAFVSFSIIFVAFAVSLVYDVQVISTSYRWASVPLLYVGLMVSVGRSSLFELERWWVPLCLWYLGGVLVVLVDLALVYLLRVNSGAAITVSLLAMGWLYFPLRQWTLGRLKSWSTPGVVTYVPDLIGAVNAGLGGTQAARQAWSRLLDRVFEPREMSVREGMPPAEPARVQDLGRELHVSGIGGQDTLVLTLAHRGKRLFTEQHAEVAGQLWRLLDVGLNQQRQTQQAVEQERLRIASDLHDDLGAKLLTIVQAGSQDGTAGLARQALDEMRQSVRGMAGKSLPASDVLADWRAELVGRLMGAGFEVQWEAPEPPVSLVLSPRLHMQLTRVLRESVSNAIRHSGGHRCRIGILFADGDVTLDIEDDGKGLAPAADSSAGLGLPNIERRARKLGGAHQFLRSAWGGTHVRVVVPLESPGGDVSLGTV